MSEQAAEPSTQQGAEPASGPARDGHLGASAAPLRRTVEDFLTDGALPKLCSQLSATTGVSIVLRGASGHAIRAEGLAQGVPWDVDPRPFTPEAGSEVVPLRAGGEQIGDLVIAPSDAAERDRVAVVVELLGSAASDIFDSIRTAEDRVHELDVLYKLTSMLVRAHSVERVLAGVLSSAIEILGLDAGSIVVLPEVAEDVDDSETPRLALHESAESDLQLMAAEGLSEHWLVSPEPLSTARVFDRMALEGEIVCIEDLLVDERVAIPDDVREEGVRGFVSVGMLFRDRAVGVIRLYSHRPRGFTSGECRLLESVAQQAAVAVEQARLLETQRRERNHQHQLRLAAAVQRRMLPGSLPELPGLDVAARYEPSLELSGDFYDAFTLNLAAERDGLASPRALGLVIGDVVGKGVAAGLLMASVRSTLRAVADHTPDLADVIRRTNEAMARDTLPNEFATLWYGVVDPNTLRLSYCGAGHDPPVIVRVPGHRVPTTADMDELGTGGLVVGIDPSQRYQVAACDLVPGDVLLAYSDGLPDARNFEGERFGKDRLRAALLYVLGQDPDASAARVADNLMWHIRRFTGLSPQTDDQTVLVLRVCKPEE
ncbi:MAG: GAF domain-containing SpoIIE family protein phosphatase [Planctomycetota bacterium]